MTGADVLARILQIEGVPCVFCFPYTPVMEGMARAGLRIILARQERVAGNMADGVSRSTNGRLIGTWTVQQSAGTENAFAGAAHSFTDSTPTLFVPGHPGVGKIGQPPTFDGINNYHFTTKLAQRAYAAAAIPQRMRMAFTALRSGRPGPVMVEFPVDVCNETFTGDLTYTAVRAVKAAADPGAVREAADRLLAATSPLIWSGHGVLYADASPELREVAELLGAPVMTTLQGKSGFPETHALSAGVGAYVETGMFAHYITECDAVLAVGTSLSKMSFTPRIPAGKTIIHATNDPIDLNKEYPATVAVHADAKLFLAQLADELRRRAGDRQKALRARNAATLKQLRAEWEAAYAAEFDDDASPINAYRMFRELWALLDPDTTMLTHESGASRDIQCVFYQSTAPRSYLGWGQSSQLGFSIGLALGAKLANPDKLVVNVMGDGAIGMTGMDLETGVRENLPILTVIKHDDIFSGYDRNIPESIKRFRISTLTGDYAAVARALGCHTERVAGVGELRPAFQRAIGAVRGGQSAVVDVRTAETRRLSTPPKARSSAY
ncbi:MAG: hypothetical protein FJ029_03435 [Actinobacteria bacterium]|nr:hypothetical protein [Actinomycetota bacterium]